MSGRDEYYRVHADLVNAFFRAFAPDFDMPSLIPCQPTEDSSDDPSKKTAKTSTEKVAGAAEVYCSCKDTESRPCQPTEDSSDDPSKKTAKTSTEKVAGAAEGDLSESSPPENSSDSDLELNNTVVAAQLEPVADQVDVSNQVEPVVVPAEPVAVPAEPVVVPVRPRPVIEYELDNDEDPEYEYS
ncbi:CLUMA_CG007547, isoform A [Clunio marinus]|uniref:CLUMA_CG007547, isoform A n=1 Tax=Clunio marinus TaxID=568069 RepID=A0A1J1I535_9DIPT|nr:CLUMA_CG007547, isoform A [Clunio marinus]